MYCGLLSVCVLTVLFEWLGSLDDFVLRKDCLTFLTDLCYTTLAQRRSQQASVEVTNALVSVVHNTKCYGSRLSDVT